MRLAISSLYFMTSSWKAKVFQLAFFLLKTKTMKNVMKLAITTMILFMTITSYGQIFGVKGGFNASSISSHPSDFRHFPKPNPDFHLGMTVEISVTRLVSIETGLMFSVKGAKFLAKEKLDTRRFYRLGYY